MNINEILAIEDETEKSSSLYEHCSKRPYADLTDTERVIVNVEDLDREVHHGGFLCGYFEWIDPAHYEDCHASLKKIGATTSLKIFERMLTVFKDSRPPITKEELDLFQESVEDGDSTDVFLNGLDTEFWKYEDNLSALVIKYAENHKEDFSK